MYIEKGFTFDIETINKMMRADYKKQGKSLYVITNGKSYLKCSDFVPDNATQLEELLTDNIDKALLQEDKNLFKSILKHCDLPKQFYIKEI